MDKSHLQAKCLGKFSISNQKPNVTNMDQMCRIRKRCNEFGTDGASSGRVGGCGGRALHQRSSDALLQQAVGAVDEDPSLRMMPDKNPYLLPIDKSDDIF